MSNPVREPHPLLSWKKRVGGEVQGHPPSPVLFSLLIFLMVLSGAHLLETISYSVLQSHSTDRNLPTLTNATETPAPQEIDLAHSTLLRPHTSDRLGWVYLFYRYLIAGTFLFFAYQAMNLKRWAIQGLVILLLVDIFGWLLHSLRYVFFPPPFSLSREQILLEICMVSFEVGVLWYLTLPKNGWAFRKSQKSE